ncbi:MAG TPA: sulfur transferase domain-containing protein [Beijerinckiaceae bacterium]|nr:sulfur transferase domain-containing protein [Beijerinckiaceae bacterium]
MALNSRGLFSLARKYDRRQQRIKRWRKPIETAGDRLHAWLSAILADHGFLRLVHPNRHRVSDELWRSAQPLPRDIAWAARNGIKTVINLRGGREFGCWALENEACRRHGIRLVDLPLYARGAPRKEAIRWARELFASVEYPALIHCKSGADRTGFAAALYLLLQGRPVEEAQAQLHHRFGHFRSSATGILDAFLETYAGEARRAAESGATLAFLDWVESSYDPVELTTRFEPAWWVSRAIARWRRRRRRAAYGLAQEPEQAERAPREPTS